ncbi:DEAD-box ATP-dependent RNA helicase 13-like isoform X1 [Spodoptera litura]|uniref:ATP-dependent RNA helicase n=1 Tax=Spodoptera litura TaxID=69820 RepID=A0A9J7DZG6_SPOLT|nr:DEAD-box ATP-dependent RNA helicase 13-like isoform X1 [Spodoptera litura]
MSKKLNNMKWESVALDGFPTSMTDKFQGFVGLEECTVYSFDKEGKRSKKNKKQDKLAQKREQKKRKSSESETKEVPSKKVKLDNGFIVEPCDNTEPSLANSKQKRNKIKKKKNKKAKQLNNNINTGDTIEDDKKNGNTEEVAKKKKPKNKKKKVKEMAGTEKVVKKVKQRLGDLPESTSELTPEDMLTWAEFKLQEPIIKALTELGFKQPTKIQQLTLPAAIHGRRDILGAAETGSGKTLAFGLPILCGILKLKEKAELKGIDVYDVLYRKSAHKKKEVPKEKKQKFERKDRKENKKHIVPEEKVKESSEDGYSSGKESDEEVTKKVGEETKNVEEDYLEEYDVPIRKRDNSADEGNESDENNYIHLSDMLDSDDLADSSDDEEGSEVNDDEDEDGNSGDELGADDDDDVESGDDEIDDDGSGDDEDLEEEENDDGGEVNEDEQGIGCVKVVDNIEIPGHVSMKTGKPLYALILTPTRELAIQISRHLIAAAKYTGIRVATIVGGMAAVKQERVLRSGPEIVVATPGRLWELIGQGQPHLQQLDSVKFLAIDETDRMVERGHFEELTPLLERLNADEQRKAARQNFVFSATLTMVHDLPTHMKGNKVTKHGKIINRKIEKMTPQQKVNRLVKMIGMTEPKVVDITTQNLGTAETLTESRITCALEHKDAYLYYIVKRHPGRTIVFCNSIGSVKRLAQLFTLLKCRPLPLHASMPQRQRIKNLERFRDDPHEVLIATDVAARGLDIPHVEHVIHYQVPRTAENYVHRSGRTARASREGLTILMMDPSEAYLYAKMCRTLNKTSEVPTFPVDSQVLAPIKELMVVARELDALELKKRRAAQAHGWKERAAREMDIIIDDDDLPVKQVNASIDKELKSKRRQLDSLLSRPIYPRGFSFKYPTLNNDTTAFQGSEENALQVMKNALESGQLKKEKRKSKNAPLLQLQKKFKKK